MLSVQPQFELVVPVERAVELLEERISVGKLLLGRELRETTIHQFGREVRLWRDENVAIVESLTGEPMQPTAGAASPGADSEEQAFEYLKDEVNADLGELSGMLQRIRLRADTIVRTPQPGMMGPPGPAGPPGPSGGAAQPASYEPSRSQSASPTDEPEAEAPAGDSSDASPAVLEPAGPPIALAEAASAALAGYAADAVSEDDLVGIDRVVDAFSYLIAARTLRPPLAIGLFGHWGSGKSFLMRGIQRRVDDITRGARESGRPQAEIGVYRRVVQVEFNAWHYVEGNLWASLVDHIFANLRTSAEEPGSVLDHRRRAITAKLVTTREEKASLNARIGGLETVRGEKDLQVSNLQDEQRRRLQEVEKLRVSDVAATIELEDEEAGLLQSALADAGAPQLHESAVDAAHSLAAARDVVQRSSALLGPMRRYGWRWVLALVAVAVVAPLISLLLELVDLSSLTRTLAAVAGFLSALAAVVGFGARWANGTLDKIEKADARVRERVEVEAAAQAERIAALQQEIAGLDRELEVAVAERDAADAAIEELTGKRDELTPGKLLAEFLEQRGGSGDYRKLLGVTAMVRRDFEELSQLVAENNEVLASGDRRDGHATDFNRVVLYVDDLDRCPPDRVVEVLQAVHLLMSFPVFVVVVAVDPRWLAQSLNAHYSELLGADGSRATPADYLEKIFQIPFRIAPLDLEARSRFVEGLLDLGGEAGARHPLLLPVEAVEGDAGGGIVDDGVQAASDDGAGGESGADEPAGLTAPDAAENVLAEGHDDRAETLAALDSRAPAAVDLNPASLRFTPDESAFLEALLPLLDTSPRSLKRYVNVYRLMKSVAELDGTVTPGPDPAPFEAAMLLLALQTGLAVAGAGLVERVARHTAGPGSLGRLLDDAKADADARRDTAQLELELARLEQWLGARPDRRWPASALAPYARHVRLYAFT